jgi:hypothetical protein
LKRNLFLVVFSQTVLSATVSNLSATASNYCEKVPSEATKDVDSVSKKLNISSCDAGNVYNYIVKGEEFFEDALDIKVDLNFSEQNCMKRCNDANQKLNNEFKNVNQEVIKKNSNILMELDFLTSCEEICHLTSLDVQVLKKEGIAKKVLDTTKLESKSELEKNVKRATKPCDPVSQGIVNKNPSYPYRYGFYRYTQGAGSVQTAISVVNGCGPKNNAQVSQIVGSLPYAEDFRPACNSHDICVTCHQLPRSGCDSYFKTNMKTVCSKMYEIYSGDNFFVKARKRLQKAACNITASLFADTVSLFGENAYQNTPVNTSTNCAACGVPIIKNTLYKTPFYVKK